MENIEKTTFSIFLIFSVKIVASKNSQEVYSSKKKLSGKRSTIIFLQEQQIKVQVVFGIANFMVEVF